MRFKAKTKDYYLIVKVKLSFGEKLNEKELDRFSRLGLRGFLKPKTIKKNSVELTGPIGQSLYERLKEPVTKREFLFIMEHLVLAIQKLQMNKLSINSLVMNIQNVYINKVTKEVQLLYVPLEENKSDVDIMDFVEAIVYSIQPASEDDAECISKFTYFIKSMKEYNAEKIENFIAKEDKSVVNTIKKQNMGQSGYMTDKPKHYYEHYSDNPNIDDDDLLTEPLDEEATGLLDDEFTNKLDEDMTGLLYENEFYDEEATGLLNKNDDFENESFNRQHVHYASLYRVSTGETVFISKPVFRVGKEKSCVDYFVDNNDKISRSHADIITRGQKYYVIDLNSTNHTYINNQLLSAQFEIEIEDNNTLLLANEEFVFHV